MDVAYINCLNVSTFCSHWFENWKMLPPPSGKLPTGAKLTGERGYVLVKAGGLVRKFLKVMIRIW